MSSPPEFPPLLAGVAAGMAHELNNQLAILMGRAELLQEEWGAQPALAEDLRVMREAAAHTHRAVQALVGLVRPRPRALQRVSLKDLATSAAGMMAHTLRSGGVAWTLDLGASVPPVWADPDRLLRLLLGLVYLMQQTARELGAPAVQLVVSGQPGGACLCVQGPRLTSTEADLALMHTLAQDAGAELVRRGDALCLIVPAAQ